jgi:clusterin-associated protein 1
VEIDAFKEAWVTSWLQMESFRTPNFALVADVLYWLIYRYVLPLPCASAVGRRCVCRYDPLSTLSDVIETPDDRVNFLKAACHIVLSKARIKLRAKSLYCADGRAVRELLKLASVLYEASSVGLSEGWAGASADADTAAAAAGDLDDEHGEGLASALASKLAEGESVRDLARAITERGVSLYELLEQEQSISEARTVALRFLDAASSTLGRREEQEYIEQQIRSAIREAEEKTEGLTKQIRELEADEKSLSTKLTKARSELERRQQRLASMKNVRPAFMDQYERLEAELEQEYVAYVRKFRNLDFLEGELDALQSREKAKADASAKALKKLQEQLEEEAVDRFRGNEEVEEGKFSAASVPMARDAAEADGGAAMMPRPRGAAAAADRPGGSWGSRGNRPSGPPRHVAVRGRMDAGDDDEEEEEEEEDSDLESHDGSGEEDDELDSQDDGEEDDDDDEDDADF